MAGLNVLAGSAVRAPRRPVGQEKRWGMAKRRAACWRLAPARKRESLSPYLLFPVVGGAAARRPELVVAALLPARRRLGRTLVSFVAARSPPWPLARRRCGRPLAAAHEGDWRRSEQRGLARSAVARVPGG
jgi:hypothetical protein